MLNIKQPTEEPKPDCLPATAIKKTRARWLGWTIGGAVALGAIGFWFLRPVGVEAKTTSIESELPAVAAVKVGRENLSRGQTFDAEFRPYEEIELHAKVSGFVESILVDVGDRVTNGQSIATLEVPELADDLERARAVEKRSESELLRAQAEHEQAHTNYDRLAAVEKAQPNLVAQQDIDLAQAKDRAAEAALETARQQILVAKAEAKKLQTMMSYTEITAPFDGVITRRFADRGALIPGGGSSSTPIVQLSENSRLRLVFPVSVTSVPKIKIGDPVEINVEALDRTFPGKISRFTRKIEMATRTMEVEAEVTNADLILVPGMYASVTLQLDSRNHALTVPIEAVSRQKTPTVFVINQRQEIEERAVKLGLETPSKIEVLAGLSENEVVMIGSRTQVKPGQKVEAKLIESKHIE
jgi:RND family efflux transporter MFP subunit